MYYIPTACLWYCIHTATVTATVIVIATRTVMVIATVVGIATVTTGKHLCVISQKKKIAKLTMTEEKAMDG